MLKDGETTSAVLSAHAAKTRRHAARANSPTKPIGGSKLPRNFFTTTTPSTVIGVATEPEVVVA